MHLQTGEMRDKIPWNDNFQRNVVTGSLFQDLVQDPVFISETQVFDVVPGKLGMKCILDQVFFTPSHTMWLSQLI